MPNARILREALHVRAIPATQEMASTAKVRIDSLDMQHYFRLMYRVLLQHVLFVRYAFCHMDQLYYI